MNVGTQWKCPAHGPYMLDGSNAQCPACREAIRGITGSTPLPDSPAPLADSPVPGSDRISNPALKKCPSCGADAEEIHGAPDSEYRNLFKVCCAATNTDHDHEYPEGCPLECETVWCATEQEAANIWNERDLYVPDPTLMQRKAGEADRPAYDLGGYDMADMRPCPFCGERGAANSLPHARVGCWKSKCLAFVSDSGHYWHSMEEAINAWNSRKWSPQPPAPDVLRETRKVIVRAARRSSRVYWAYRKSADSYPWALMAKERKLAALSILRLLGESLEDRGTE